jgi:hypothetical protein
MDDRNKKAPSDSKGLTRRDLGRKGAKAAYVVPAILAAIKATERPAFAQASFGCDIPAGEAPILSPDGTPVMAPGGGISCIACTPGTEEIIVVPAVGIPAGAYACVPAVISPVA